MEKLYVERKKIYVGCALTHASDKFKEDALHFRDTLDDSYDVLKFVGISPETSPAKVFDHDISCVEASDLVVGVCDEVSTGLGMEIGYGLALGKRILLVGHRDRTITKMVTGAGESKKAPSVQFERYTDLVEDIVPVVHHILQDEVYLD